MRFIMRFPPRSKKARKANTPVSLLAQIYEYRGEPRIVKY